MAAPPDPPAACAQTSAVPPDDRGLLYGDGVFRTFRHGPQGVWDRDAQFELLERDCRRLDIPAPSVAVLDARIAEAVSPDSPSQQVVRVTVTRGSGARGYRSPSPARPALYVMASAAPELRAWDSGYRLRLCDLRLGHQPLLAGVKHLNRLENILARAEWGDPGVDDGVLLDQTGSVVETVSANVFWRSGGQVFTPALDQAGVAGRQRARVLDALRARGGEASIGHFPWESMAAADEAWVCNSVIGLRAVTAIGTRVLRPGDTARALAAGWFADWQPRAS